MFKQCCGCKGRPDPDTDDEKEKLQEAEKNNSVSINVKEEKAEANPEVVVSLPDRSPLPEVKNETEEAPLLKKEQPQKESKNPGLTIDTSQDQECLEDDDDNMIVPITPRTAKGLTPHPAKRNSTPGLSAIPKWLSQDDDEESGGTAEPPVTPVGRDELALRRHRFFSDLLVAAQAATEHRVRFDPLGPSIAGQENLSPAAELNTLLTRLENVTSRLEQTVATTDSPKTLSHSNSSTQVNFSPTLSVSAGGGMSSQAFQDIISGPLTSYLTLSSQLGGEVAAHAKLVSEAFQTQLQYLQLAECRTAPSQAEQGQLLQPTSLKIQAIQELREKNRTSQYFNHLSAISESIPALGWVTISPAPAPYIKEMNDAGQFYTNRVLKDWKQKDQRHVDWVKAWVETLTELQGFVKQHHTTGLVWAKTGAAGIPPPPPPGGMPPPPPVLPPLDTLSLDNSNDRSALFAQINQGEDITKSLKKVTSDMQTHKNPNLRTGPAPFKAPVSVGAPAAVPVKAPASNKPPVFARDGKKWLVEHQRGNKSLVVEGAEMNNVVYMYGCLDSTLTVKGKINSIFLDSCRKSAIVFDSLVSSVEFVNCQSVQMQVLGKVPTISIDKTDGCQIYLSPESMDVEIVSSKSSEMNVMVPKASGDFAEFPIPEQYKTTVSSKGLSTVVVESKG
uniref:Adenylyl cyclase-associated protein n=2 Tax=Cuerna arida TaxID=1464854 RepID=A0A1B6FWV4_9HEMI